jgi:tetratricopeptide (TPR) repeat protein
MLNAMRAEGNNPETAIAHYRYVVSRAEEDRNLAFMVPAYLRLGELLEKSGKAAEALEMVERCLRDYGDKKKGPDAPTEAQRTALNTRKNLLAAKVKR